MKSTGIVREVDDLGRIVIPKEIRKTFIINKKDRMECWVNGTDIIFRKYEPYCSFCGNSEELENFDGKRICSKCIQKIAALQSVTHN